MPLFNLYHKGDAIIAVWHILEKETELLGQLYSPSFHQTVLHNINKPKRRLEYLSTRLLLQKILPGSDLRIRYMDSGKPYLEDPSAYISISHTNNYAAVIYHPQSEVGIDIESYSEKPSRLAPRYMSNMEINQIQDQDKYIEGSLLAWSAKESMFKIMPDDSVDFRDHLILDLSTIKKEGVIKSQELRSVDKLHYNINYYINEDFVLTYIIYDDSNE